jgi:hypothetical protein
MPNANTFDKARVTKKLTKSTPIARFSIENLENCPKPLNFAAANRKVAGLVAQLVRATDS